MAKLPAHIQRRNNRYYAVLNIPAPLRKHYPGASKGKHLHKLVQSLETENLSEAKRRVVPVVTAWKRQFSELRNEPNDDASYFRRRLQRAKTDAGRDTIMTQIEMEVENLASPSLSHSAIEQPDDYHRFQETEAAAQKRAGEFYEKATGKIVGFTDYLDDWLAYHDVTDKTKDMNKSVVKRFAVTFPTIQDVTHEGVQRWVDGLGVTPKTTQRILGALRVYWRYLQRSDIKAVPKEFQPFTGLDLPKKKANGKDSRKPFTAEQIAELMTASAEKDTDLHWLIVLASFTGCRIEELCSLKTEHVHLSADIPYIEIEDAKTPAGWRQVPIHPSIEPALQGLVKHSDNGYVLKNLTPNKYGDRSNAIGKRFGHLKRKLGHGPDRVFHSIRKTVATQLENAGVPENVSADILGHEKNTMTYGLYSGGASLKVKVKALEKVSYG